MVANREALRDGIDDREQERLIELFSNRVALKKAYSQLRQRERALQSQLGSAEQRAADMERRLAYLEGLLTDEDTALGTMVYYHLRGLWRRCHRYLGSVAEQMSTRISGRRTVAAIEAWRAEHAVRLAECEQQLVEEKASIVTLRQLLRDIEQQRLKSRMPWHWLRRRRLSDELVEVTSELRVKVAHHDETLQAARTLRAARAPVDRSLQTVDKRAINLQLLARAQFLAHHFAAGDLVAKARNAMFREVGAIDYGDETECRALMSRVDTRFAQFQAIAAADDFGPGMDEQANRLAATVVYAEDNSVLPEPAGRIDPMRLTEARSERFAPLREVLDGDLWSVSRVFLTD